MIKSDTFNYLTPDKHGFTPGDHYISVVNQTLKHSGNGKLYRILGFAWMGSTDEWGFLHISPEGVHCVRPIWHMWGKRADGTLRYTFSDGVLCPPWYDYVEQRSANADEYQKLQEDYEDLVSATADLTDAFLQVPSSVSMLQAYGNWLDRWAKPAICKIAKAVGHKATQCDG